jgi:alanyl-tRNA synthetase
MKSSADIRKSFIEFFKSKQHEPVSSSPVIPEQDPTLLFINAGMNQFKDVFLGEGTRPYTRAVNSQICIRVSGKHNDLEDVGKDTTHLTSFEMLGNWSFGDYYKKEAITWAWEYLTQVLNISKDVLYVTVYKEDDEARKLWKTETDINPARIVSCGEKDNFWEMGEVGPCGPCSEIHIDLTPNDVNKVPDERLTEVELGSDRFIELWNLVFIQYNRSESGELEPLPFKHVDTGAGLERLVSVSQGTLSNYQTDLFNPIINEIETITGIAYTDDIKGMPHRVLADHVRTLIFGIADNVLPSNEGRGYVLRRLLRRALRYSKKLNVSEPLLFRLVDSVIDVLGCHFEHLALRKDYIKTVIKSEEDSFLVTLEQGLVMFERVASDLNKAGTTVISGEVAFKLYDTYGFPLDLTEVMAAEGHLTVDVEGFNESLNKQRELSRKATKEKQHELKQKDSFSEQEDAIVNADELALILQSEYTDNIARGGEARIIKNSLGRLKMARHHSGTHILHEALRRVLGEHVHQAGSLVDTDRLRFDFTHFSSVTSDQLKEVELICNKIILENIPITASHMTLDEAKKKGVMALFGEKYDKNDVRVIKMGDYSTELCGGTHVNATGLLETLKIVSESAVAAGTRRIEAISGRGLINEYEQSLKINVLTQLTNKKKKLNKLIEQLTASGLSFSGGVSSVNDSSSIEAIKQVSIDMDNELKRAEKVLEKERAQKAGNDVKDILLKGELLGDVVLIKHFFKGFDMKMLHTVSDNIVNAQKNAITLLASTCEEKGFFLVKLGKDVDLTQHSAATIIKSLTTVAGGGGGGKAEKAQAGGADPLKLEQALNQFKLEDS